MIFPEKNRNIEQNSAYFSIKASQIPTVTTEQMREVDRLMIEKYGIQLIQMMENAGLNLAKLVRRFLKNSVVGKHLLIASGKGGNGGGGLVAARHLYNWGTKVTVLIEAEDLLKKIPKIQWKTLKTLPLKNKTEEAALQLLSSIKVDLVIDALIGYGLESNPRGWSAKMIKQINMLDIPIVALDVPSGLDATTGDIYEPCIRASATLMLALPKTGLIKSEVKSVVGSLFLADISVPDVLYKELGLEIPLLFAQNSIIHLDIDEG